MNSPRIRETSMMLYTSQKIVLICIFNLYPEIKYTIAPRQTPLR